MFFGDSVHAVENAVGGCPVWNIHRVRQIAPDPAPLECSDFVTRHVQRNFWFRLRAAKGVSNRLPRIAHFNGFAFGRTAREYRWLACRAFGESLGRE